MLTELREVYEGQIEAKDAALTAKDETIAELRRRAEAAEEALAAHLAADRAQAVPDAPGAQEAPIEAQEDAPGVWGRLWRWWGG